MFAIAHVLKASIRHPALCRARSARLGVICLIVRKKVDLFYKQGKRGQFWYRVVSVTNPQVKPITSPVPGFKTLESMLEHAQTYFNVRDIERL